MRLPSSASIRVVVSASPTLHAISIPIVLPFPPSVERRRDRCAVHPGGANQVLAAPSSSPPACGCAGIFAAVPTIVRRSSNALRIVRISRRVDEVARPCARAAGPPFQAERALRRLPVQPGCTPWLFADRSRPRAPRRRDLDHLRRLRDGRIVEFARGLGRDFVPGKAARFFGLTLLLFVIGFGGLHRFWVFSSPAVPSARRRRALGERRTRTRM